MPLTDIQIERLLKQRAISAEWPWATDDERVIDKHIKDVVAEVCRKVRIEDKTEFGHYGSGYASFVDCWLYRPNDAFRYREGDNYHGLVVLFSRLSPFYVLGQGEKSWDKTSGMSYAPSFEFVDEFDHQAIIELVPRVSTVLSDRGCMRLHKSDLDSILPSGVKVHTVLADGVLRHFDALFYWED